jgi:hypothetical protein
MMVSNKSRSTRLVTPVVTPVAFPIGRGTRVTRGFTGSRHEFSHGVYGDKVV